MEPTTVIALRSMEKSGLIRRVRSSEDKRRSQVWLTSKGQRMRNELLALARGITDQSEAGITSDDLAVFRQVITRMTANLDRHQEVSIPRHSLVDTYLRGGMRIRSASCSLVSRAVANFQLTASGTISSSPVISPGR